MFYYHLFDVFLVCIVLFSGFLQFNGNFVDAQNNSEYRDWAPLTLILETTGNDVFSYFYK